jgi:serine/threonine-protein kinase
MMRAVFLIVVACGPGTTDSPAPVTPPDADTDADTDADADADADADTDADPTGAFFPAGAPWTADVTSAPVDPTSGVLIAALQERGWGFDRFQIDFSLEVLDADADTPRVAFTPTPDFYSPDCDHDPVPMPDGGNLEGEDGYACVHDGDCHLLVVAHDERRLYEMWRANLRGDVMYGGCLAVWDLDLVYPPEGRGEQCTSADAAGYPIAPLLMTADEVAAGEIPHALRFILPNTHIRDGAYFHPASHATNADGGGADAIPYGARLRLRADFDRARVADPDALVVVDALQKYGMFLADGGNVTLTARSDRRASTTWAALFEDGSHALEALQPEDFEVLLLEPPEIPLTFDCVRNGR